MKTSRSWSLGCILAAAAALLAGCAADPAQSQKVGESRNPCVGVAPATGTMLRKKEDCDTDKTRATATPEQIEEFRRPKVITQPMVGTGAGR